MGLREVVMLGRIYYVSFGNQGPHRALGRTQVCSHHGHEECVGAGALEFLSSVINSRRCSVGLEDSRKVLKPHHSICPRLFSPLYMVVKL